MYGETLLEEEEEEEEEDFTVLHGSVLGNVFFLIYINDMAEYTKYTVRLFGDDTIIYFTLIAEIDYKKPKENLKAL